jgi:oxygen-dependent protoporphyrinogen oxidase
MGQVREEVQFRYLPGRKVIVVGGGVCGLTAAYRLKQRGFNPIVLEQNDYSGGRTRTFHANGFTMDEGAALFPSSYAETYSLAVELGLQNEIERVAAKTALYLGEVYHEIDGDHPLSSLLGASYLGWKDKLSLLRLVPDLLKHWNRLGFADLSRASGSDDGTAQELCQGRGVSQKAYDLMLNPLVRAMSSTDGNQISSTALLWYLKNFSGRKLFAFRGGMQRLASVLSEQVDVFHGCTAERVDQTGDTVTVVARTPRDVKALSADFCIVASDGRDLQRIYGHALTARQNQFLADLRYLPLKVVNFFTSERPELDVFAVQIPEVVDPDAGIFVLAHNLSRSRAPQGKGIITFAGTADWQLRMQGQSDEACIADVRVRARNILPFLGPSEVSAKVSSWSRGTAIAYPGLFQKLGGFIADIDPKSRVLYAGDYLSIPTVNTAVSTANAVAQRLAAAWPQ